MSVTTPVKEPDLQAFVDGQLTDGRRAEVDAYLASSPGVAERLAAYQQQVKLMHDVFDGVLDEPVPDRLQQTATGLERYQVNIWRYAAALAWLAVGGIVGWTANDWLGRQPQAMATAHRLVSQAALAHVVYAPEMRHPVEVTADQQAHLVKWLSKRLGGRVSTPNLKQAGYRLVGGRLLPGDSKGPAAQFMYQNDQENRLTLYVRSGMRTNVKTAFRYIEQDSVGVFYWIEGSFGYGLAGHLSKHELLKIAHMVYGQLTP